jgi:tRNA (guanine37-N1)-methyltransferase
MNMSKESFCLKVTKKDGEKTLIIASKLGLSDKSLQIQKDASADLLFIPITRAPDTKELSLLKAEVTMLELQKQSFALKARQEKTLSEILQNELPSKLLSSLPRALDVIGDIAIIEVPSELEGHKTTLGAAILKTHRNLRTVLAKVGAISGIYRLREFGFIAGEHKTTTLHKEYGCSYYVDVAKAYFSPRLSHEHWRVASLVKSSELVVDLFAGVGPFAIPIAKSNKFARIYAIDINPEAIEYLKKNIRLNKVDNQVFPIVGDAYKVVKDTLQGVADRVIMNLPETANEFIDVACKAVKPSGGIIHFYGFVRMPDTIENFQQFFSEAVAKTGRRVEKFYYVNTVRATAPYEWQVVLDAKVL